MKSVENTIIQILGEESKTMISKQLYLLLTGGLLLLSVGTGFAMQQHQLPDRAAFQALETANFQLGRSTHLASAHRQKAIDLVRQAMQEMESGEDSHQ